MKEEGNLHLLLLVRVERVNVAGDVVPSDGLAGEEDEHIARGILAQVLLVNG